MKRREEGKGKGKRDGGSRGGRKIVEREEVREGEREGKDSFRLILGRRPLPFVSRASTRNSLNIKCVIKRRKSFEIGGGSTLKKLEGA